VDRSAVFDVYAPTPEIASQVNLSATQGSGKVSIVAISSDFSDGVASFKVIGLEPSNTPGDVELTATAEGETATTNLSVVTPKKFGQIPNIDQNVTVQSRALDKNTNPRDPNATPGFHTAAYIINVPIQIEVLDQFDAKIGGIYSGAVVSEGGVITNTPLNSNSKYNDYVGILLYSVPNRPGDANSPQAIADVQGLDSLYNEISQNFIPRYTQQVSISVEVAGFSIGSFTRSHDFTFDAPPPGKTGRYKVIHSIP
jgi:hypothetical protein